jgi:hypothetical protein
LAQTLKVVLGELLSQFMGLLRGKIVGISHTRNTFLFKRSVLHAKQAKQACFTSNFREAICIYEEF